MHAALTALQQQENADAAPLPRPAARERLRLGTPLVVALAVAATAATLAAVWPFFGSRSGPGELRVPLEARVSGAPTMDAPVADVPVANFPVAELAATPAALAVVDTTVAAPAPRMPEPTAHVAPAPAPAPAVPAAATAVEPARIAIETSAAEAPQGDDAQAVAQVVAALEQAMRAGDLDAGNARLEDLAAMLPARSLTLLRMQAWHAHQSGHAVRAIALYGEVLQRVPGDRNAAINLAVLEAGQGDVEGASQRLRALRASVGESEELAAAMALVGAQPR